MLSGNSQTPFRHYFEVFSKIYYVRFFFLMKRYRVLFPRELKAKIGISVIYYHKNGV